MEGAKAIERIRVIGLDPGLAATGWGILDIVRGALAHVACGVIGTNAKRPLAARLVALADGLEEVLARYRPDEAAVEETFVNCNALSALRLGQARGIALLVPARAGIAVGEYLPNLVKKTVVGSGHAGKEQVQAMVRILLPGAATGSADASDALAVAICHAHHRQSWPDRQRVSA